MGFFGEMSDKVGKGLDWGEAAAKDAYSAAVHKTEQAKEWAANKVDQVKEAGREKAHGVAREQVKKAVQNKDLLNKLDRRKDFTSKTIQGCGQIGSPPVQFDGSYMDKNCKFTKVKPAEGEGIRPQSSEKCANKKFPQVTFTNGIDNSQKEVCETLHQLADDLCMEVVGIYNASYKDATPPPRSADENMALLKAGAKGAGSGALDGMKDGMPDAILAGVATGGVGGLISLAKDTGKGAAKGALKGAAIEGAKQEVPRRLPQSQDALDVIDTLRGSSTQPATDTMATDIANSLRDGQPVNIIAHSEGGVNAAAAIAQAKA